MARRDTTPLGEAREAAGLSQDQAAALIGVTKATIQNWERGRRRRISGDHLEKAAEIYRITTREFLALMDAGQPPAATEAQQAAAELLERAGDPLERVTEATRRLRQGGKHNAEDGEPAARGPAR